MSAEIINFVTRYRTPGADEPPRRRPPDGLTRTAKNTRLRAARWDVWRKASILTDYWHAFLKFTEAVALAKRYGLNEARTHGEETWEQTLETRWSIFDSYREALGKQLLTPAPNMASVDWKRRHMGKATGVKKELLEKSIADDIAFLDAHPTNSRLAKLRKGEC